MPKVSVVIPNYNHAVYLEQRLTSILNQTFKDFEIIFLDDNSTDSSFEIAQKILQETPSSRLLKNIQNSGTPYRQWNKGAELASGDYLWIAESDDVSDPRFLATLVPLLENNDSVGMAVCQSVTIDETGKKMQHCADWLRHLNSEKWQDDYIADGRSELQKYMVIQNTIPNASAVLFRKDAYLRAGKANVEFVLTGDWLLYSAILKKYDIAYSAQPLNHFRLHASSATRNKDRDLMAVAEAYRVTAKNLKCGGISQPIKQKSLNFVADKWFRVLIKKADASPITAHLNILKLAFQIDALIIWRLLWLLQVHVSKKLERDFSRKS